MKRTDYCGQIDRRYLTQTVTLAGWVHRRRDHGGVIFIDLRDREGLVQVVCDPDRAATFATAETLRNEFCVAVTGLVRPRPAGTVNANLVSGEIEVLAHTIEVLNASLTPPFQMDDENLSETVRLEHRVLDLRRPEMQQNLGCATAPPCRRANSSMATASSTSKHRFCTKSTPEGARDFLVPSRIHTVSSSRCRSRPSYSSSCSWWQVSTATIRLLNASAMRICAPTANLNSLRSTSRLHFSTNTRL